MTFTVNTIFYILVASASLIFVLIVSLTFPSIIFYLIFSIILFLKKGVDMGNKTRRVFIRDTHRKKNLKHRQTNRVYIIMHRSYIIFRIHTISYCKHYEKRASGNSRK